MSPEMRAALRDLRAHPGELYGSLALITALCAGLLSGWLGRIMGSAAALYSAIPPHAL